MYVTVVLLWLSPGMSESQLQRIRPINDDDGDCGERRIASLLKRLEGVGLGLKENYNSTEVLKGSLEVIGEESEDTLYKHQSTLNLCERRRWRPPTLPPTCS